MGTLNMNRKTNNKIKDVTLALVLIGSLVGVTISASVNAAPAKGIENTVSKFVADKGQQMFSELNAQLQQSIDNEIKAFSVNFALNDTKSWLAAEKQVTNAKTNKTKITENKVTSE